MRDAPLAVIAGVGHVESAARGLAANGLDDAIRDRVAAGTPVLGICVGMQLLFGESEEGGSGLGLLAGPVRRIRAKTRAAHGLERPLRDAPSALVEGLDGADVYFAHSFAVEPHDDDVVVAVADHDGRVVAAVERGAVAGVQFHPERSARAGRPAARERAGMVKKRVIPCLDVAGGRVVKGVNFVDLREMGEPIELATRYSELGADELVFLDITATLEGRGPILELIERAAAELTIPFTVGGGVTGLEDARSLLRAGADKVGVNRAAFDDPSILTALADEFGSQAVVCAIDAKAGEVVHARRQERARPRRRRLGRGSRGARRRRAARDVDRRRRHSGRVRPATHARVRRGGRGARDRLRRSGRRRRIWRMRSPSEPRRRSSPRSCTSGPSGCPS